MQLLAHNYDPAGNRLAEVTGSGTTAGQFNTLNQLTGLSSSTTSTTVAGHASAAITSATINALSATITSGTNFSANVPLPTGATNVVSVVATPTSSSAPVTTQRYQVVTTGTTPTSLSYDANGNVTTDESGNTYAWDALNRLITITYSGGATSNFAYDGLSRRVSIIEKNSGGTVTSTKNYLWIGSEIAEERDASNTVTKRFFSQGEQQSGTNYYYTRDHLGSVREMCSSTGSIVARYGYDPYGRTTLVSGSNLATFQYTGDYAHQASGLSLTYFRAYDPNTGRWLSRDPLEEEAGINLYDYVGDNPDDLVDPFGLQGLLVIPEAEGIIDFEAWLAARQAAIKATQMAATAAAAAATAAAVEKETERRAYKARCDQKPPPGLCPCDLWRWLIQRNADCKQMRNNFTKKWYPNGGDAGHQTYVDQLDANTAKLMKLIAKNCK
jgi:RHS repeat-associated protein